MTTLPTEVRKRHCLILKILEAGGHIMWTRRRMNRITHFLLQEHHEITISYDDWQPQVFGFHSKTLQEDITTLFIARAISLGYFTTPPIEAISLTDVGRDHISTAATQLLGDVMCRLVESFILKLRPANANFCKDELIEREVFQESNPNRAIWELKTEDVIEDSEFGTAYIVVNKVWIPVEAIAIHPSVIWIREGF